MSGSRIILIGHGSRIPEANEQLRRLAHKVGELLGGMPVESCYMMGARPNLEEAVDRAVEEGASRIVLVPMFLYNGMHVQKDIPEQLARLKERYPQVEFTYAANLGADWRIAQIIVERIKEVAPGELFAES